MPPVSQLFVTCPSCKEVTPRTMATCVKCGAPLPNSVAATNTVGANSATAAGAEKPSNEGLTEVQQARIQEWNERVEVQERPDKKNWGFLSKLLSMGMQGAFYIVCLLVIVLLITFIGPGVVRSLLERVFQR